MNDTLSSPMVEGQIRWARYMLTRMQDVNDKLESAIAGKAQMGDICSFPSVNGELHSTLDVSGSLDEYTVLEDAVKRANFDALSSSPNSNDKRRAVVDENDVRHFGYRWFYEHKKKSKLGSHYRS